MTDNDFASKLDPADYPSENPFQRAEYRSATGSSSQEEPWSRYPPGSASARTESWRSRLPRRSANRMLGGVCAGLAEEWDVSPSLVRLGCLAACLLPGPMWVAYAMAWVLMPGPARA